MNNMVDVVKLLLKKKIELNTQDKVINRIDCH